MLMSLKAVFSYSRYSGIIYW